MKNMKKVLAVMTAVSAMAASTSAFAATTTGKTDSDSILTFVPVSDTVTSNYINVAMPNGKTVDNNEVTLLVLDDSISVDLEEHTVNGTITDEAILYIDQGTVSESVANPFAGKNLGLKVTNLVAEAEAQFEEDVKANAELTEKKYSYPVRLGYYSAGEFAIAEAAIDITVSVDETGTVTSNTVTLVWGDLNGDGKANGSDAVIDMLAGLSAATAKDIVGSTATVALTAGVDSFTITGAPEGYETLVWGDLNGDGKANGSDAVIDMLAGLSAATEKTICNGTISVTAGVNNIKIDFTNKTVEFVED